MLFKFGEIFSSTEVPFPSDQGPANLKAKGKLKRFCRLDPSE
jgi:hypothetical protein